MTGANLDSRWIVLRAHKYWSRQLQSRQQPTSKRRKKTGELRDVRVFCSCCHPSASPGTDFTQRHALFMPADALLMQLRSSGYVICRPRNSLSSSPTSYTALNPARSLIPRTPLLAGPIQAASPCRPPACRWQEHVRCRLAVQPQGPHWETISLSSVPGRQVAITGRPLASIPDSLDGRTNRRVRTLRKQ